MTLRWEGKWTLGLQRSLQMLEGVSLRPWGHDPPANAGRGLPEALCPCPSMGHDPSLTLAGRRQPNQAWGVGPEAEGVYVSAKSGLATQGSGFN